MANEYMDIDDIQNEYKNIPDFATTTKPTLAAVTEWMTWASRKIDSKIGNIYSTPVSETASPNSYIVLQEIGIKLVKFRLEKILNVKTTAEIEEESPVNLYEQSMKELDEIVKDRLLHDGVRLATNTYGIKDYNYANDVDPTFDVTKDQW